MRWTDYLRGGAAALRARLTPGYSKPIGVYIELLSACNYLCRYCNIPRLSKQTRRKLETELVLRLLGEFRELGALKVNFTGGEPLLHEGLGAAVRRAKELGLFVALPTNGSLVEERVDALEGADLVMVSLDGREENHDSQRGVPGSFRKVWRAMEILRERGIRFWTTTVVTRRNAGDLEYLVDVARRFGTYCNFAPLEHQRDRNLEAITPAFEDVRDLALQGDGLRAVLERILALKRKGAPIGTSAPFVDHLLEWDEPGSKFSERERGWTCMAGRLYCMVHHDGKLYSCGDAVGVLPGRDLRAMSAREAFETLPVRPKCRSCTDVCEVENNLIYNLQPRAVAGWLGSL